MIDQMYADCLTKEAVGGVAFDDFCANIELVCHTKEGDFEWEIQECRKFIITHTFVFHEPTQNDP
jgi:hypothetical protein